mmetsp:Transcript_473/g.1078  ORF Transcript_473/g.1078 Transcript_473/m.1078 type:complete len:211 (-) Transcript_473:563-1195(-)
MRLAVYQPSRRSGGAIGYIFASIIILVWVRYPKAHSKIDQYTMTKFVDKNVLRTDITVTNTMRMDVVKRKQDLPKVFPRSVFFETLWVSFHYGIHIFGTIRHDFVKTILICQSFYELHDVRTFVSTQKLHGGNFFPWIFRQWMGNIIVQMFHGFALVHFNRHAFIRFFVHSIVRCAFQDGAKADFSTKRSGERCSGHDVGPARSCHFPII